MNRLKMICALLLAVVCTAGLTGCGTKPETANEPAGQTAGADPQDAGTTAASGTEETAGQVAGPVMQALEGMKGSGADAQQARATVPSAIRFVQAPEDAFRDCKTENARVIAATADGQNLLITAAYDLYIWDTAAGERISLSFSREDDLAALEESAETIRFMQLVQQGGTGKKKTTEEYREDIRREKETYLAKQHLARFETLDQVVEFTARTVGIAAKCTAMGDRWALVEAPQMGFMLTVDMRTGESRFVIREDSRIPPALCGNTLLLMKEEGLIHDLDTGESFWPVFAEPAEETVPEDISNYSTASRLLPDGSILLLQNGLLDRETGKTNLYLTDRSAGKSTVTPLGPYSSSGTLTILVTGDGKYAAVAEPYYGNNGTVILNRETGEKQQIEPRQQAFICACDTGFVCFNIGNNLVLPVLLNPETMEQTILLQTGDGWPPLTSQDRMSVTVMDVVRETTGNGRMFFAQSAPVQGYFILEP